MGSGKFNFTVYFAEYWECLLVVIFIVSSFFGGGYSFLGKQHIMSTGLKFELYLTLNL